MSGDHKSKYIPGYVNAEVMLSRCHSPHNRVVHQTPLFFLFFSWSHIYHIYSISIPSQMVRACGFYLNKNEILYFIIFYLVEKKSFYKETKLHIVNFVDVSK